MRKIELFEVRDAAGNLAGRYGLVTAMVIARQMNDDHPQFGPFVVVRK